MTEAQCLREQIYLDNEGVYKDDSFGFFLTFIKNMNKVSTKK